MGNVVLVARLVLAAVFLVAGLAKLADLRGSRRAMSGFGLPDGLAGPAGLALPLCELAVVVALLPSQSAVWGGVGALLLLLAFIAGISLNMARGRAPDCHCFGQLHSEPIGRGTLARNVVLAVVALYVAVAAWSDPGPGALDWLASLTVAQRVAVAGGALGLALLAAQVWLLYALLRRAGTLVARIEGLERALPSETRTAVPPDEDSGIGLPVGTEAPAFALPDLSGRVITLDDLLRPGKPAMLIFVDPTCGPCRTLKPEIARWQREYESQLTIAVLSRGTPEENAADGEPPLSNVLLQQDQEMLNGYEVWGTPGAVVVRPDGTIGSRGAQGSDAIRDLLAKTLPEGQHELIPLSDVIAAPPPDGNGATPAPALEIGDPAPAVTLRDLQGADVHLEAFRGRETLLLFWSSNCGFCQRMLGDLRAWEANPPTGAPQLVVVIPDPVSSNQVIQFRSTVLVDPDFTVATAFSALGTPMAVLLDPDGRIASGVAEGAEAVLALANGVPA